MKDIQYTSIYVPLVRDSMSTQQTFEFEDFPDQYENSRFIKKQINNVIKGGTTMGTITLIATTLGVGMMTMPANAKISGLPITLLISAFSAYISYTAMGLISWSAQQCHAQNYSDLVLKVLGHRINKLFGFLMVLYNFGNCVSSQIVFQVLTYNILQSLGYHSQNEQQTRILISISYILPNFLLSLQKSLYNLRYFTIMGVAFVSYFVIAMIIDFTEILIDSQFTHVSQSDLMNINIDQRIFITLSACFYCYVCHQFILPIRNELIEPTLKRQNTIHKRSSIIIFMVISTVIITGYLTFKGQTDSLVINNYTNFAFLIGKIGLTSTTFLSVPLNILACRSIIWNLLFEDEIDNIYTKQKRLVLGDNLSLKSHIIITFTLQILSALVAIMFPQITYTNYFIHFSKAIGFIGGFLGTNLVCVFPTLIFFKLSQPSSFTQQNVILYIGMIVATVAGWTGAVLSILL